METKMKIEIEKNVPLSNWGTKPKKYPFSDMKVGDSFKVEGAKRDRLNLSTSAYNFSRENPGYKFTVRTVQTEGDLITARCWRILDPRTADPRTA